MAFNVIVLAWIIQTTFDYGVRAVGIAFKKWCDCYMQRAQCAHEAVLYCECELSCLELGKDHPCTDPPVCIDQQRG